jgi:HEAT repeat protein
VAKGSGSVDTAVAALTRSLRSEKGVRQGAAALGLFTIGEGASAAAPALTEVLTKSLAEGEDPGNRSWLPRAIAVTAPGTASAGEAVNVLTLSLAAKEEGTRAWAAEALGRFGPAASAAVPRLRELRNDRYLQVAAEAKAALEKIETPAARSKSR